MSVSVRKPLPCCLLAAVGVHCIQAPGMCPPCGSSLHTVCGLDPG